MQESPACTTEPMLWKKCQHPLQEEDSVKLAYIAETSVEEAKQCLKAPVGQGAQRLGNRAVE